MTPYDSNNELLNQVEEYASLYLTIDEIALLCNLNADDFRREVRLGKTPLAKAYLKGKLQTTIELRRQTKLFAEKGSPQAEALMAEYEKKQKLSEK